MTPKRFRRREWLFFIITGLIEGMLTALTLASGKILRPGESITHDLALHIGLAAGFSTIVVFFAAEYARQRQELLRMAHQLNLTWRARLADGKLGHQAWRESSVSALVSGLCSFGGAGAPLTIASVIPGSGWPAVLMTVCCLGGLGAGWIHHAELQDLLGHGAHSRGRGAGGNWIFLEGGLTKLAAMSSFRSISRQRSLSRSSSSAAPCGTTATSASGSDSSGWGRLRCSAWVMSPTVPSSCG